MNATWNTARSQVILLRTDPVLICFPVWCCPLQSVQFSVRLLVVCWVVGYLHDMKTILCLTVRNEWFSDLTSSPLAQWPGELSASVVKGLSARERPEMFVRSWQSSKHFDDQMRVFLLAIVVELFGFRMNAVTYISYGMQRSVWDIGKWSPFAYRASHGEWIIIAVDISEKSHTEMLTLHLLGS